MEIVSNAYKTEMKKDLRNESYVWVYMGVINKEAQASAYIDSELTDYASDDVFHVSNFEAYYATCEENYCKVDGSMFFLPENSADYGLFQGAVTNDICGSMTFRFKGYENLDIKGLTIDFGEYYPTSFTVTNGTTTKTYANSSQGQYVLEDVFADSQYMTITPITMVGGSQRMRILSISFGVGLSFDNNSLISTKRKTSVSHISEELPSKSFTFVIDNYNRKFDVDDPNSFSNFLEEQQKVIFSYGRKLDDTSIYKLRGGNMYLSSWSSTAQNATFVATGLMDFLNSSYYKGKYYADGITLYDLAKLVLSDAGITSYRLDSYLRLVTVNNPMPNDTHKNCLQLIANAANSILYEDRDGAIVIESSFVPSISNVSSENPTAYTNLATLTNDTPAIDYADCESDYCRVDGSMTFIADSTTPQACGYVSKKVYPRVNTFDQTKEYLGYTLGGEYFPLKNAEKADAETSAASSVTVTFNAQWTFFYINMAFGKTYPSSVIVHKYADDVLTGEETAEITAESVSLNIECDEVDKITIEFTGVGSHQRVHLNKLSFTQQSDYILAQNDMADNPKVAATERVKTINAIYYKYSVNSKISDIGTISVSAGDNLYTTKTAYSGWSAAYGGDTPGTLTIVESGAYYVIINSTVAADVKISAYQYDVTESAYSYTNDTVGSTKTIKNELISTSAHAKSLAQWLGEYFSNDAEYTVTYRGEPRIDCDDLIYMESDNVKDNLIRIESEELSTSTGMSNKCKLTALRTSYGE